MGYQQIMQRTWQDNVLLSVMLELTYRCNLNCFFCYNDVRMKGALLRLEDYQVLLRDLQHLGTLNLTLTGGEPLAHPDFFAIGRCARERGFVVRIKSNGHALSAKRARRIQREIDPFVIDISLHGACAETHDRQTRVPGSFERLLQNLQNLLGLGLRIKLNSTLTAWNEHEIGAMFNLADGLGVRLQFDPQVTPRDDGDEQPLTISASRQSLAHLFKLNAEYAVAMKATRTAQQESGRTLAREANISLAPSDAKKHCGAGSSSLHVDPFGNVFPCVQWRRKIGNLRHSGIRDIWQHSQELKKVRLKTMQAKQMMDTHGNLAGQISFCPGLAEQLTGDPLKLYAGAKQRLAIQTGLKDEDQRPR